jgi:hypothetical protein
MGSKNPSAKLQIVLPSFPDAGSWAHFEIIRKWLSVCDQDHERYGCHSKSESALPTRVLDVGKAYLDFVGLYCSKKDEQGDYIALSHCWSQFKAE